MNKDELKARYVQAETRLDAALLWLVESRFTAVWVATILIGVFALGVWAG